MMSTEPKRQPSRRPNARQVSLASDRKSSTASSGGSARTATDAVAASPARAGRPWCTSSDSAPRSKST